MIKRGNEFIGSMVWENADEKVEVKLDLYKLNPESSENHDMWFDLSLFNMDFEIKTFGGYVPKDGLELTNLSKYFEILNDEILYKAYPEYVGFEYFDFTKLAMRLTAFKDLYKDINDIEKAVVNFEFPVAGFKPIFYINDLGDKADPKNFLRRKDEKYNENEESSLFDDEFEDGRKDCIDILQEERDIVSEFGEPVTLDEFFSMYSGIGLNDEDDFEEDDYYYDVEEDEDEI